jgi:hypothetical protein
MCCKQSRGLGINARYNLRYNYNLLVLREKHPQKTATDVNHSPSAAIVEDIESAKSLTVALQDVVAATKSLPNGLADGFTT